MRLSGVFLNDIEIEIVAHAQYSFAVGRLHTRSWPNHMISLLCAKKKSRNFCMINHHILKIRLNFKIMKSTVEFTHHYIFPRDITEFIMYMVLRITVYHFLIVPEKWRINRNVCKLEGCSNQSLRNFNPSTIKTSTKIL